MELDATSGGATANSYVTVAAASDFLEGRLHTEPWFGIEDAEELAVVSMATRATALMWATQLLDQQIRWYGTPTTLTQALAWPRVGMIDHLGRPVSSLLVPSIIQRATAFYALALLSEESSSGTATGEPGIKSKKIGDLSIVYQDQASAQAVSPLRGIPAEIRAMLRPYGAIAGGITVPLVRV